MEHATDPAELPSDAAREGPTARDAGPAPDAATPHPVEIGGPTGPEPTRYGDWERKGRCYDF